MIKEHVNPESPRTRHCRIGKSRLRHALKKYNLYIISAHTPVLILVSPHPHRTSRKNAHQQQTLNKFCFKLLVKPNKLCVCFSCLTSITHHTNQHYRSLNFQIIFSQLSPPLRQSTTPLFSLS